MRGHTLFIMAVAALISMDAGSSSAQTVVAPAAATPPTVTVQTLVGELRGVVDGAVASFKGIPYAAAPTGNLRWMPPQPAAPWSGVRSAAGYGNDCMQHRFPFDSTPSYQPLSEDCLYLNVWAPAHPAAPAAVLVWIHGGGLVIGSGSAPVFDGTAFARKGVVLVTLNYRLGRFGFFAHPALAAAHAGEPLGNYGLMDQIAALQWVRNNIEAFGGDPANITIFGQSSGGVSVAHLMAAPQARGLFAKAIVQSGGGREHWARMNEAMDDHLGAHVSALDAGLVFAKGAGVPGAGADALAALRALPAEKVLGDVSFINGDTASDPAPMIDGGIAVEDTDAAFRNGKQVAVPLMIGTTDDELGAMPGFILRKTTKKLLPRFGERAAGLDAWYGSGKGRREDLFDDTAFVEPARYLARRQAAKGVPVWLYRFSYVATGARDGDKGAEHASELPYLFGTLDRAPPLYSTTQLIMYWLLSQVGIHSLERRQNSADDYNIGNDMQDAWIAFARSGDPNRPGSHSWPRYSADVDALMTFSNDGPMVGPDPIKARLDYITGSYPEAER